MPPGTQPPPGWPHVYAAPAPLPRPHGLPLATPGARLVARIVDILAVTGLALLANGWFLYSLGREFAPFFEQAMRGVEPVISRQTSDRINTLILLISIVSAAVWLAYEVPAMANSGQTPGKRLLGIKVVRLETTDRLGFGRALGRWTTLGLPTLLWPCCGVGLIFQIVDCLFVATDRPLRQALHDKRAQTVVVQVAGVTPAEPPPPHSKPDGGPQ